MKLKDKKHAISDLPSLSRKLKRIDEGRNEKLRTAKENREFRKVVTRWAEEKLNPTKILSDKQRLAIFLMCDFVHNFSNEYIYTRVGITATTFSSWRNDPLFLRELDKEITRRRNFIRIYAFRNIHRAIMRGDMKATWNYLKMSGDLKEQMEVVDRTGEQELDNEQLDNEIKTLQKQLKGSNSYAEVVEEVN